MALKEKDHVTLLVTHYICTVRHARRCLTKLGLRGNDKVSLFFITLTHNEYTDSCTFFDTKSFDWSPVVVQHNQLTWLCSFKKLLIIWNLKCNSKP